MKTLFFRVNIVTLLLVCSTPLASFGQAGIWDNAKDTKQKAAKKISDGKTGLKKWKDHLENWGKEEKYTHHLGLGGKLNSNGWSGGIQYLKKISPTQSHLSQLYFSEIKHEKQQKQQKPNIAYPDFGRADPFVYGKINNLYTLQLGYGRELLLFPGVIDNNLSVSFRYSGGFSLAMLKPYYLKLVYTDNGGQNPKLRVERYSDINKEQFLRSNAILGGSNWSKGLGEIKPIPGAYAEAAIALEVGKSKVLVQTITLGANIAYYPDKPFIMAEVPAYNYQGSLYVGLTLGKKWK